ncbi:MAG: NADP-dependent oxidoreductase [Gammaproteobacteria bacterium AqS3]|nr:NADP-dependent oxidoreductase [Gammaproteobacteria bacterium AqS3]
MSTDTNNLQVRLVRTPKGVPVEADFQLVETDPPAIGEGEVLCRNLWLSLDPYMRSQIAGRHLSGSIAPGDVLLGETVAEVIASHHDAIPVGAIVRGFGGWQTLSALPGSSVAALPEALCESPSLALGALGMPGLTAWAGLKHHVDIQPDATLLLGAATGAVGSVAAGLARHWGARVVGVVGSEAKRRYALETLGCTEVINRNDRSDTLDEALRRACPDGIDIYFDLVGGALLHSASAQLAHGGHIILCGLMAEYNSTERSGGPAPGLMLRARATLSSLVVYDYEHQRGAFIEECLPLIQDGAIAFREDITDSLAGAPAAFCRLMRGENFGKALVRVG